MQETETKEVASSSESAEKELGMQEMEGAIKKKQGKEKFDDDGAQDVALGASVEKKDQATQTQETETKEVASSLKDVASGASVEKKDRATQTQETETKGVALSSASAEKKDQQVLLEGEPKLEENAALAMKGQKESGMQETEGEMQKKKGKEKFDDDRAKDVALGASVEKKNQATEMPKTETKEVASSSALDKKKDQQVLLEGTLKLEDEGASAMKGEKEQGMQEMEGAMQKKKGKEKCEDDDALAMKGDREQVASGASMEKKEQATEKQETETEEVASTRKKDKGLLLEEAPKLEDKGAKSMKLEHVGSSSAVRQNEEDLDKELARILPHIRNYIGTNIPVSCPIPEIEADPSAICHYLEYLELNSTGSNYQGITTSRFLSLMIEKKNDAGEQGNKAEGAENNAVEEANQKVAEGGAGGEVNQEVAEGGTREEVSREVVEGGAEEVNQEMAERGAGGELNQGVNERAEGGAKENVGEYRYSDEDFLPWEQVKRRFEEEQSRGYKDKPSRPKRY